DAATARHAMPSDVERVALVTNPLGAELKRPARIAFLHDQLVTFRRFPEFAIEPVAHSFRRGHPGGQVGFRFASHRVTCAGSDRSLARPSVPTRPSKSRRPSPGRLRCRAPGAPPR